MLTAIFALACTGPLGISGAMAGDIWDGTNDTTLVPTGDPNWSNPANWNLDTLPDFLGLTFAGTVGLNNNNDTTGTTITGAAATPAILFDASAGAFVIGGNAVTLGTAGTNNTANITNSSTNLQTINFNISLPVVSTITMTAGGGNVTLGGIISGFGGLTTAPAASGATLTLNGANTYTGATTVANGTVLNVGNSLALQNSAVTLNSTTANSLTFATGVTSATLGSLASAAGAGSFALTNASAAAVALTAGGNNTSTTHNGNLTGIGSLTKTGFGALTLASTSNTYGGGTNLNGGTLSISADTNIGGATSAINFNGGILQITSAAITNLNSHVLNTTTFNGGFDIANPLTISQSLSGSGSLLKAGAGVLTLAGTNSYSGGTTILAGTIQGGLTNFVAGGNIADFGTVAINQTSSGAWAGGTINGTGGLSVSTWTAGSVTISLGGTNLYTGGTTVGTTTSGSTGVLSLTGATAIQNSTVTIAVGTGVNNTLNFATGIGTFTLGGLASAAGTANIALTDGTNPVTLIVGNNNANTTFNGVLSGTTGALTKIGTGTLTLAGSNTYTGRTTVNRG